jgi:hypothetical protein
MIMNYGKENKDEEILSIQMFAGNGVIENGRQNVLINKFNQKNSFYEMIGVELALRNKAKDVPNCFFLILDAW